MFEMEHTNLLYYATQNALESDYPDGKVDSPTPGVAYAHDQKTVLFNKKKTSYEVEVSYEDRSGNTLASGTTVNTPEVLEGNTVKVIIYPAEVANAKPVRETQKITVSADTDFTFLYYVLTSYTVTVHHMYEGSALTADTTIIVSAYEEDMVTVRIEPESIAGYAADTFDIEISGDCEYTLVYGTGCETYEFVDLGLPSGTLWATCNLGAETVYDIGNLYAWGETETKDEYTLGNYSFYDSNLGEYTKYNQDDGKEILDDEDDAARQSVCGGEANIPTVAQWDELICAVTVDYTHVEQGYLILRPRDLNGGENVELIIPRGVLVGETDDYHAFWLSEISPTSESMACFIEGGCEFSPDMHTNGLRYMGLPIRPVIPGNNVNPPINEGQAY